MRKSNLFFLCMIVMLIALSIIGCKSNTTNNNSESDITNTETTYQSGDNNKNPDTNITVGNTQEKSPVFENATQNNTLNISVQINNTQAKQEKTYSLSEISGHSSKNDCWMAVSGKVYDVTKYVNAHPGGSAILMGCGKDATSYFSGRHSNYAWNLLSEYYIGDLVN